MGWGGLESIGESAELPRLAVRLVALKRWPKPCPICLDGVSLVVPSRKHAGPDYPRH